MPGREWRKFRYNWHPLQCIGKIEVWLSIQSILPKMQKSLQYAFSMKNGAQNDWLTCAPSISKTLRHLLQQYWDTDNMIILFNEQWGDRMRGTWRGAYLVWKKETSKYLAVAPLHWLNHWNDAFIRSASLCVTSQSCGCIPPDNKKTTDSKPFRVFMQWTDRVIQQVKNDELLSLRFSPAGNKTALVCWLLGWPSRAGNEAKIHSTWCTHCFCWLTSNMDHLSLSWELFRSFKLHSGIIQKQRCTNLGSWPKLRSIFIGSRRLFESNLTSVVFIIRFSVYVKDSDVI